MGVHRRVAVAGEVLAAAQYAARLQTAGHGHAVIRDGLGRFAVAPHADDHVLPIGVHVQIGSQIKIHAQRGQLLAGQLASPIGILHVA